MQPGGEKSDKEDHQLLPPSFDISALKFGLSIKFGLSLKLDFIFDLVFDFAFDFVFGFVFAFCFFEGGFTGQAACPGGAGEGGPGCPAHSSLPGSGAVCPQGSVHKGSGEARPTCSTTGILYSCTKASLGKDISPATCRGSHDTKGKVRPYSLHFASSHTTCPPI